MKMVLTWRLKSPLTAITSLQHKAMKMVIFISAPTMRKMMYVAAFLCLLGLTDANQERVKLLKLLAEPTPKLLQSISHTGSFVAVSVNDQQLDEISSSVLMAESWVRTHVLTHFPAVQISTIVVGETILCNNNLQHKWGLVLPSVKNIYHSLVRWGLDKDIKVSASLSAECLHPFSFSYREDLAKSVIKPLLEFFQTVNSTISVNAPSDFSPLVYAHRESLRKLWFFKLSEINVLMMEPKSKSTKGRKLSFLSANGFAPLPPSMSFPFAPQATPLFPFAPQSPHLVIPTNPPSDVPYPPCNAAAAPLAPAPTPAKTREETGLWCVAKPSVPEEKLKEALDYACGAGGADCEEIRPHGRCYYPDTMVAHASYAFNSYWQKSKRSGGTCNFQGTAMVINANPSFQHCRFILS